MILCGGHGSVMERRPDTFISQEGAEAVCLLLIRRVLYASGERRRECSLLALQSASTSNVGGVEHRRVRLPTA